MPRKQRSKKQRSKKIQEYNYMDEIHKLETLIDVDDLDTFTNEILKLDLHRRFVPESKWRDTTLSQQTYGERLIRYSIIKGRDQITLVLLNNGANPNGFMDWVRDINTPLELIIDKIKNLPPTPEQENIIDYLFQYGAIVTDKVVELARQYNWPKEIIDAMIAMKNREATWQSRKHVVGFFSGIDAAIDTDELQRYGELQAHKRSRFTLPQEQYLVDPMPLREILTFIDNNQGSHGGRRTRRTRRTRKTINYTLSLI